MKRSPHSLLLASMAALVAGLACASSDAATSDDALPPLLVGRVEAVAGLHDSAPGEIPIGEFTDIRGLTFDQSGRMVVADNASNQISVFSPDGQHLFSFGREGAGPADFQGPCCISVTPENHLLIEDFGNRRYTEFALDSATARLVGSWRMASGPSGRWDRVRRNQGGAIWHYSISLDGRGRSKLIRSLLDSESVNTIIDTLPSPSPDSIGAFVIPFQGPQGATGVSVLSPPYSTLFLRAVGLPGGYADAVSSTYAVALRSDSGSIRTVLRREVPRAGLSSSERERAERIVKSVIARNPSLEGKFEVPPAKPPLEALGVDLDGRLWVVLSRSGDSTRLADVYTADGEFIERREWPRDISLSLFAARGNHALGVQRDSLGIERVVRMEFEEAP